MLTPAPLKFQALAFMLALLGMVFFLDFLLKQLPSNKTLKEKPNK